MNPLLKIALYLLVVGLCAIFISPAAYWFIHWLIDLGFTPLAFLENFPFHRYFSRTLQVSAIVLAPLLAWWLSIRTLTQLGLEKNPRRLKDLTLGLNSALIPLTILAIIYFVFAFYRFQNEPEFTKLFRILGTAAVVACLEEFFFRGVLLGLAVRSFGKWKGALFSALIFAVVHFLRPARLPDSAPVDWGSGWSQLFSFTHGLPTLYLLSFGFASLLLSGLILAWATLKTKSLYLPIGIHAAWVFGQQSLQVIGKFTPSPKTAALPWVGPNLVSGAVPTGLLPLLALISTACILFFCLRSRQNSPQASDEK
ncbi:MAG: lysostaphin resistance A-like protein [Chthoniobacterales bacterium]